MGGVSTLYDLEGGRLGRTEQAVELFLAELAKVLDVGPGYVLTHPAVPAAFLESLRKFCPVVTDPGLPVGATYLIEGVP